MRDDERHRAKPAHRPGGATAKATKIKPSKYDAQQQQQQKERRGRKRVAAETETETAVVGTLKPHKGCASPVVTSSRFQPIRFFCSRTLEEKGRSRGREGRKGRRKRVDGGSDWDRKWVFSSLHDSFAYRDNVTVVSYNILGVENVSKHPELYDGIPSKFLEWDRRKELIHKEICCYKADILCFQEVDRFNDIDDLLKKDAYRGVHKARTGEANDGCAIFWKEKMFTLLHEENIEFQMFGLRNNVAQLCILKMNENHSLPNLSLQATETRPTQSRIFLVGNIHVLFNPNRGDIKLGQVRIFLERAYKLSQEWGGIPVIIGGDLNSMPQSAMYQFVVTSKLDTRLHSRRSISGQLEFEHTWQSRVFHQENNTGRVCMSVAKRLRYLWNNEELRFATGSDTVTHVQHALKLCRAYLGVPGSRRSRDHFGEPLATSYHSSFMGTVDYIWHSEDLVPVRVLETLPVDILKKSVGLPNERFGSDHLALACELAFADDVNRM